MKVFRRVFVLSLIAAVMAPLAFSSETKTYKVGDAVKPFALKCEFGHEQDLSKVMGKKIVVLEFWNMQCPVSRGFEEQYKSIAKKYGEKEVAFYAVDSNTINSVEAIKEYAKENKLNYPVLKDEGNEIADRFGAAVTPEVFVIGKDKKIHYHGAISDNKDESKAKKHYLTAALDSLLDGKQVEVKQIKAFGCGIKRAE